VTADDPDTTDASPASRARARFIEVIQPIVDIVIPHSELTVFVAGLPTVSICTSQGVNLLMACTAYATKHSKIGLWTAS